MKASETKFQPIIEGTKQYVVPLFQRPYSWGKKEWEVLWEDLVYLCANEEPKSHFIGSIVTMPTVSVPEGVAKYLLIDGQQRLTTIFILLALLRNFASASGNEELSNKIAKRMLINEFEEEKDYLKLLPTQVDRPCFEYLIGQKNSSAPASKMLDCYSYFERKLRQGKVSAADLNKAIASRLSVVSIVLDYDDNPHLVFESLNAKGRPLAQADLIRNYFFMRVHVNSQEQIYAEYWEPMQNELGDNLTEYIRHYLMRRGTFVKQSDVYFTLKDRIGQSDALEALKDIALFAAYYKKLLSPEAEPNEQIRFALRRLNRVEVTTAYPFLLSCYQAYTQGELSTESYLDILRTLENFIMRRFVCNIPSNELIGIFPSLYEQAKNKNPSDLANGVRIVLQARNYPKDAEFKARLIESKLYGAGDRLKKTKLLLETLEESFQHKEPVKFDNVVTIEHIMPQTLTEWWQAQLGEEWQGDHELCLHTLGNLTLTAYNSELSNDSFPEKKRHLNQSHLELNRYFQKVEMWNRTEIERRSRILAEMALEIWPYFGDETSLSYVALDSVTGRVPSLVSILGQEFRVESWREVLLRTLNTIAELEPELFSQLASEYPRFISKEISRFRSGRQLSNGYYVEVNISAKDIYRFCQQSIESIGLSRDDWRVEAS